MFSPRPCSDCGRIACDHTPGKCRIFEEIARRPHTIAPDALGANSKPRTVERRRRRTGHHGRRYDAKPLSNHRRVFANHADRVLPAAEDTGRSRCLLARRRRPDVCRRVPGKPQKSQPEGGPHRAAPCQRRPLCAVCAGSVRAGCGLELDDRRHLNAPVASGSSARMSDQDCWRRGQLQKGQAARFDPLARSFNSLGKSAFGFDLLRARSSNN